MDSAPECKANLVRIGASLFNERIARYAQTSDRKYYVSIYNIRYLNVQRKT